MLASNLNAWHYNTPLLLVTILKCFQQIYKELGFIEDMIDDIGHRNYRKLSYYFEKGKPVHFKDLKGTFYNGEIIDLDSKALSLVIIEYVFGEMPFLLEDIQTDSITEFRRKE